MSEENPEPQDLAEVTPDSGKVNNGTGSPERQASDKIHENGHHTDEDEDEDDEEAVLRSLAIDEKEDAKAIEDNELIKNSEPTTELEHALVAVLARKTEHIQRLKGEIDKLRAFISKRKQTYKRKRKDEGAPTRALSAYNLFIKERFAQLAKENEEALKSADSDAVLKRVPPANLVARTGNEWKELSAEEKAKYEERYDSLQAK